MDLSEVVYLYTDASGQRFYARLVVALAWHAAGRPPINEAWRDYGRQLAFRIAYENGTGSPADDPRNPGSYVLGHVRGIALDIDPTPGRIQALSAAGLVRPFPWESWHWAVSNPYDYGLVYTLPPNVRSLDEITNPRIDEQEDEDMIICEIDFGGNGKHIVGLAKGLFAHLQSGDAPPIAADITGQDRIYQIGGGSLPFLLDRYGCDLNIWDFRENGFAVLDPLAMTVSPGNTWTDTKAIRAELSGLGPKLDEIKKAIAESHSVIAPSLPVPPVPKA